MEKNFQIIQINLPRSESRGRSKAEQLSQFLICFHNQKNLDLSNHLFGTDGVQIISRGLNKCVCLESLDLSSNLISDEAYTHLSPTLFRLKSLRDLNLSNNQLSFKSSQSLSFNLCNFPSLIFLNLSNNNLGIAGGKAISKSLPALISLKGLVLSSNNLQDEGSASIINSLKPSQNLNYISFKDNSITVKGYNRIIIASRKFTGLKLLHIEKDPCKEMRLSFMLNSVGMKGLQGDVPGLKLCQICKRHCEEEYCQWSRVRALALTRMVCRIKLA